MQKDLTLESLDKSLEQSKRAELEKQQQIELESMNEFQESLRTSFQTELDLIKEDIYKVQKFVNGKNKIIATNAEKYSKEIEKDTKKIEKSFQELTEEITEEIKSIKLKQWIMPTAMGISIVIALALGTWGIMKYLSHEIVSLLKEKERLEELIVNTKKIKNKYVEVAWLNGIGVKRKPRVFKHKKMDIWVVQFEKVEGE